MIGARNPQGEKKLFDIFENQHNSDHILEITHSPAQCTNALQNKAFKITSDLMEKLNLVGLICVEFFEKGEVRRRAAFSLFFWISVLSH